MRTYALYGIQGEMLACGVSEQEAAAFIAEMSGLAMRRGRLNAWALWIHARRARFAYDAETEAGAWRQAAADIIALAADAGGGLPVYAAREG